jgi:hypothetical protein
MPEEYTFLLNKSYSQESWTDFPGKREWQNRRDPGKSGTGNPGNETLVATGLQTKLFSFCLSLIFLFYKRIGEILSGTTFLGKRVGVPLNSDLRLTMEGELNENVCMERERKREIGTKVERVSGRRERTQYK